MSSGFRKNFEWRRAALILVAAAVGSSGIACSSDDSLDESGSNVSDNDDEDDTSADEDDGKASDDEGDDEPAKKPDAKVEAKPGKDAGMGTTPPDTGDKTPPTGGSVDSLWCKAQPIIRKYCQDCHVADAVGPMPLVTVDDFLAEAPNTKGKKVSEVTKTRMHATTKKMPPQEILTAEELKAVDDWIDDGAKPGSDPTCGGATSAAPPAEDLGEWPPPGCEQTYKILTGKGDTKATVAANTETHPQFVMDAPWGAGAQGLGFKPVTDNKRVLHHWIVYDNKTRAFINGWAPGKDASKSKALPDDVGVYLPSGAGSVRLDVHYNNLNNNKAELDQSGVEVCTTTKPRKYMSTTFMGLMAIPVLPPGESDSIGVCNVSVKGDPVFIIGESPHAHQLAKHMKLEHKRGGQVTMLHDAPFDFEEQVSRPLDAPFEIKTGDVLTTTCHFNNDTGRTVTFGENTGNEMCFNFISYYPKDGFSCGGGGGAGGLGGLFGGGT